jgi:branched-chain amino acid transport system ATP-binding protein
MADLLAIQGLSAGYGRAVVLSDIAFRLGEGEALAVLGRNGMGKTTLIDSIVGVTRRFAGSVSLAGRELAMLPPEARAVLGIGWVPQERNIFRSLTVEENLTAVARPGPWTIERVFELFPGLKQRRKQSGGSLSGGEQQMLAIGRALATNPKLLLLDEPTEGLAPIIIEVPRGTHGRHHRRAARPQDPADHRPRAGAGAGQGGARSCERIVVGGRRAA